MPVRGVIFRRFRLGTSANPRGESRIELRARRSREQASSCIVRSASRTCDWGKVGTSSRRQLAAFAVGRTYRSTISRVVKSFRPSNKPA